MFRKQKDLIIKVNETESGLDKKDLATIVMCYGVFKHCLNKPMLCDDGGGKDLAECEEKKKINSCVSNYKECVKKN